MSFFSISRSIFLFFMTTSLMLLLNTPVLNAGIRTTEDYVPVIFSGSILRECSDIKNMPGKECENKRYFIRYMTTKLVFIHRGYIFGHILGDNLGTGFEHKPIELTVTTNVRALMRTAVSRFSQDESRHFQACLQAACAELIAAPDGAGLNLSNRWHELSSLVSCIASTRQNAGTFDEAKRGVYGRCFSKATPHEVINVGIAISIPGNKF